MRTPHVYETHTDCRRDHCVICDGGLAHCTVCGGFEGSLTTDCAGRRVTGEEIRRIYDVGDLDYRDGGWVDLPNFPRSVRTSG